MNTAVSYRKPALKQKGISAYQENQILNLSPTELILKLYDLAILSIKKNDIPKANRVIAELISSLNFDYKDVSLGLFKLYRFCQDNLYQGNKKVALDILQDLRDTWAKAFNLS
ncbi:MAG: flagellar export chaperone FliS [Calditrichia bacterium]